MKKMYPNSKIVILLVKKKSTFRIKILVFKVNFLQIVAHLHLLLLIFFGFKPTVPIRIQADSTSKMLNVLSPNWNGHQDHHSPAFQSPTSKCWIFSGFYLTRVSRCGMVIIILCQTVFNAFFKDELRTMGLNWKLCLFFLEKIQKTKSFLYSDFSPQSETVEHSPCPSKVQSLKMFLLIKPKKKCWKAK